MRSRWCSRTSGRWITRLSFAARWAAMLPHMITSAAWLNRQWSAGRSGSRRGPARPHSCSGLALERLTAPAHSRRLVYMRPMRALVEQTNEVSRIGARLNVTRKLPIMGGEVDEWETQLKRPHSRRNAGTHDLAFERVNRGYAMSRYQCPFTLAYLTVTRFSYATKSN